MERRGGGTHSVSCKWNICGFSTTKQKTLWSKYFEVGGYDCRLLVYPTGDSQALPGYVSVYLQISDPRSSSSKWDCFASYRLSVRCLADDTKSVHRDSWHRFSAKRKSHGWCDFAALSTVLEPRQGFLGPGDTIQVSTDITILDESVSFAREADLGGAGGAGGALGGGGASSGSLSGGVYGGRFTWRVRNFDAFAALLRTQKIMSPGFPAGDCMLRLSVYQSTVSGADQLSLCLESKDTERAAPAGAPDRTAWCLFRLAVHSQLEAGAGGGSGGGSAVVVARSGGGGGAPGQVHRDSYGRFAGDARSGDNTSLGWNDFMRMDDFLDPAGGYLVGDAAVFSASFHVIREHAALSRHPALCAPGGEGAGAPGGRAARDKRKLTSRDADHAGRFLWRIEHFTRLKDLLKRRRLGGLCIKSRRFAVGGRDCRLIVYPRGQSQPPTFLSMFLEVSDPRGASAPADWTAFVSHRLSVVNQRAGAGGGSDPAERSVSKESQNRYSRAAKDWGWREFISLTALFDADAGYLVGDAVVFCAEVLVLRESAESRSMPLSSAEAAHLLGAPTADGGAAAPAASPRAVLPAPPAPPLPAADGLALAAGADPARSKTVFTWRIENLSAFKDVIETRKVFSRFFSAGPVELRLGLYESFDSLCVYLESDAPPAATAAPAAGSGAGAGVGSTPAPAPAPAGDAAKSEVSGAAAAKEEEAGGDAATGEGEEEGVLAAAADQDPGSKEAGAAATAVKAAAGKADKAAAKEGAAEVKPASYWVRYRVALLNQRHPEHTEWKEAGMSTRSWSNSVLQFGRSAVSNGGGGDEPGGGLVVRDCLALCCEVLEVAPWTDPGTDGDATAPPADSAAAASAAGTTPPGAGSLTPLRSESADADLEASTVFSTDIEEEDSDDDSEDDEEGSATGTAGRGGRPGGARGSSEGGSELSGDGEGLFLDGDDVLAGWLAPAGIELLGGDGDHPPLLSAPPDEVAGALCASLAEQPGAVPLLVASLRMYMDSLSKVKRLLLPSLSTAPTGGGGAALGIAPGVLSLLMRAPELRAPLLSLLLDVMLDHCLTARMHAHQAAKRAQRQAQLDAAAEQQPPVLAASAAAAECEGAPLGLTKPLPPRPSTATVAASLAAEKPGEPDVTGAAVAEPGGSLGEAGSVLALVLGWMHSLDATLVAPPPDRPATPRGAAGGGAQAAGLAGRLSPLQKATMLLADAPLDLQPDIVALVPRLVEPREHTAAAGALLCRLAEASREGPEAEAALRLPVLSALGALRIDPSVTARVLQAALEALPALREAELAPAVGLVLKLAAAGDATRREAVRAVRARLAAGEAASAPPAAAAAAAVRQAALQHRAIALSWLSDMEAGAAAEPANTGAAASAPAVAAPAQLCHVDMDVLADCLSLAALRPAAAQCTQRCIASGALPGERFADAVARRVMHARLAAGGDPAEPATAQLEAAPPAPASAAQRAFLEAHPMGGNNAEAGEPRGSMPAALAAQLGLHFPVEVTLAGLPPLPPGGASAGDDAEPDELGGLLGTAEAALQRASALGGGEAGEAAGRSLDFATRLYRALFESYRDDASRAAVLRMLARRAATAPSGRPGSPQAARQGQVAGAAAALLLSLAEAHEGAGRLALEAALEVALEGAVQADATRAGLSAAESRHAAALAAERAAAARADRRVRGAEERAAELDARLARTSAEHAAELANRASDAKEQTAKARALEQQVEWVRSERDEERTARAKDASKAEQRVAEAEAQLARLRTTRRDDQKKAQRDRTVLADRVRELEEGMARAEADAARMRADAAAATARAERNALLLLRRAEAAERALAERAAESSRLRAACVELEAKVQAQAGATAGLERALARSVAQHAPAPETPATGSQLEAAARMAQEQGMLRAASAMLSHRTQHGSPGATPVLSGATSPATASLTASPVAPKQQPSGAYRPLQGMQGAPRSPLQGSAPLGVPGQRASGPAQHAELMQGLRGTQQRMEMMQHAQQHAQHAAIVGGGSLFGAASSPWAVGGGLGGLGGQAQQAQQRAQQVPQAEVASSPGGMDAAAMERLMGLLPSDLLHS